MLHRPTSSASRGSAYVVVLLVLLILSILAPGLLIVTSMERQIGVNERQITRTFFASESGLAVATGWMFEGSHDSHSLELSPRSVGTTTIRDQVETSRVLSSGSGYSALSDITHYSTGRPQVRHDYRLSSNAQRLAGNRVLTRQEVRLMIQLDPWDEGAVRDLRAGQPEYDEPIPSADGS